MIRVGTFTTIWMPKGYKHPYVNHDIKNANSANWRVSNWARELEFNASGEDQPYYALEVLVRYTEGNGRQRILGKFVNGEFFVKVGNEFIKVGEPNDS